MEKLRVGLIAPPWVPVPPPSYGGTEAVIDNLARGLVAAGHDVVLFTTGDSTCPVPRRWAYPDALGTGLSVEAELHHVEVAYKSLVGEVDVIHDHTLFGPWRHLLEPCATPVVATHHGPFTDEMVRLYEPVARGLPLVAISAAQAASAPTVAVAAVILHGIDTSGFPLGAGDGGYVAFLGRMNPDKGPHRAIAAARAAGVPIRLAAKMWEPAEQAFFAAEVAPLLGSDATYVGELGGRAKLDFLAGASALLNPIGWPEPFGLVMIEAMATGTPVISFPAGAAPEIVRDGINGALCEDVEAMSEAIPSVATLDRSRCRASVEERFSVARMVEDHVDLYRRAIEGWGPR
ncbi:MAG TPA: glycosyltransferase [Acidimicrobiales bacterium]|nr:glycosyltransferase [Acidimicrobiales bacterium]